ncbi:MAG: outer rane beta-barrel protein [Chitinophagaceae bacterium]|nr:outer rane beta-barrel protein [Chitinophagaceae bacterium]
MRYLLFCLAVILVTVSSYAQQLRTISGSVTDTTGTPLRDVYVKIISGQDSVTTATNTSGVFRFASVKFTQFTLSTTMIGFENYVQVFTVGNNNGKAFLIDPIKLKISSNQLSDVTVVSTNPITIKEDTIEYKVSAYKVREGAPIEDVIKKLPGVTVDKDGNVTAQGKQVKRVRVNGKDYFGGDVQTATQNLPADIIDNIQIIDDYGDRANLTGIKEGEPEKILNINVQKGKNRGTFGNGSVAAGTEGRYTARISANNFKEERQISLLGSLNNTNANTFNFNGGGRGGGARGANFGSAERGGSGGDGTTFASSLGLNYRDSWSKKLTSYGSYSYTSRNNNTTGNSFQQDFNPLNKIITSRVSANHTATENHRATWNLEYKIDTSNYLKLTPYFSYASSSSAGNSISEISKAKYYTLNKSQSQTSSSTPAGGSDLLYNHRFKKRGRNFSLTASVDYSARDQNRTSDNSYYNVDSTVSPLLTTQTLQNQQINNANKNTASNVRASYTEPISRYSVVEVSYAWNRSATQSNREVSDINPQTGEKIKNIKQSNDYDYQFVTNRIGLSLHTNKPKYNFLLGVVAQPSNLSGTDIGRKITTSNRDFNIAPNARFVYNFARSHSFTVTYGGSSREPNFAQLQPVSDSSNLKNIVTGNPDLNAEFTNRFSLQYNKVGILTGSSLFTNLSFDQTQNKIVSSRVNDPRGTGRTTTYLNTNGFYGLNGNFSYSKPFFNRKFTVSVSTSASYDNNISFTDNQKNKGQNWVVRPGMRLNFDFENIIDAGASANYTINKTITRYPTSTTSTEVRSLNLGLDGRNYFLKDWTLGYDLQKIINSGYLSTVNTNPTLLNLYIERRFLKNNMATARIQGFDLFNQNTGISREVNGTTVTDIQNNRLGRYFIMSFTLRLQKFAGSGFKRPQGQRNGNQMRPGNGGGNRNNNGGGNGGGGGRRNN